MLDVLDFIKERGGDPDKVRASQRKRFAPESVVDEVIELWQDARRSESNQEGRMKPSVLTIRAAKYEADQFGAKINAVQKEIGQLKKVRPRPSLMKSPL
jgi:seryl-tRNA synthetase